MSKRVGRGAPAAAAVATTASPPEPWLSTSMAMLVQSAADGPGAAAPAVHRYLSEAPAHAADLEESPTLDRAACARALLRAAAVAAPLAAKRFIAAAAGASRVLQARSGVGADEDEDAAWRALWVLMPSGVEAALEACRRVEPDRGTATGAAILDRLQHDLWSSACSACLALVPAAAFIRFACGKRDVDVFPREPAACADLPSLRRGFARFPFVLGVHLDDAPDAESATLDLVARFAGAFMNCGVDLFSGYASARDVLGVFRAAKLAAREGLLEFIRAAIPADYALGLPAALPEPALPEPTLRLVEGWALLLDTSARLVFVAEVHAMLLPERDDRASLRLLVTATDSNVYDAACQMLFSNRISSVNEARAHARRLMLWRVKSCAWGSHECVCRARSL